MVKTIFILLFSISLFANVYQNECESCHKKYPVSLDKFFYRYLLKYSSEREVKSAMIEFLKEPNLKKSVMPEGFINRFGIKEKSSLSDKELREAIDIYWEKYKVFGKLK